MRTFAQSVKQPGLAGHAGASEPSSDPVGDYRRISYWFDSLPSEVIPRPALDRDIDVDVAVVGGGYTGLWTAYYLATLDPSLQVAVVEKHVAGFGASGRNGGWCSAFFAQEPSALAAKVGLSRMHEMRRAMEASVDEVGAIAAAEGIDCHFRKAGSIRLARSPSQLTAAEAEVEEARELGIGQEDVFLLDATEASAFVGATKVAGAVFTPHCASLHPARLVRGLAEAAERRGVTIYEETPVNRVSRAGPGGGADRNRLDTPGGRVRAAVVVRATEGYTATFRDRHRSIVPIYSLMVATEPLPGRTLENIGIDGGLTFSDGRHLIIYGQRTTDGRLAFGGRGAPYHFASRIEDRYDQVPKVHEALRATLADLFPDLGSVAVTHKWGGPIGVHRDWFPSVLFDKATGVAEVGGYVGDGVSTTNLAGRTLADLITGRETELTQLCWVGHRSRQWEPEPFRWMGVNTGLQAMSLADAIEDRTGRPSHIAGVVDRLTGH